MISKPSPLAGTSIGRVADLGVTRLAARLKSPLQFLSFWGAIALPFAHLSLLAQGLESLTVMGLFVALLALNVVALYVGHGYKQS